MAKSKKNIKDVVQKEFPDFTDEVNSLSAPDLNSRLASLAKAAEESESSKEDDEDLESAKASVTELSAPYKDAKKAIRMKSRYIIALLKEKGADA